MNKIILLSIICILAFACSEDNDDNLPTNATITFTHAHHWDGTEITSANYNSLNFTNENGEVLNISGLRYLTSRYQLTNTNGDTYTFDGYNFVDIQEESTYSLQPTNIIPTGTYTLSMIWGFNEEDNIDAAYPELNSESWNWPAMLGGGYHFMQLDGMYQVDTTTPKPFNYHNGTAMVSSGVFEQNFVNIEFSTPITITNHASIEIQMNVSEWFKNPYTWDLNVYDVSLMANYEAQKLMQQNASSVFKIGTVTQ